MEDQREYLFEFSVVMAVYNVEPFLREAVDSLIAQDFGFEQIQLIMVDDGSTDGSGAICNEYAKQYPENVVALHKENGGVSSARNEGLRHVQGRYVNFLDADDKLEKKTMSAVYEFFQRHEDEIDVVSIPIVFFDGQTGQHILNYKFRGGTRVIDLQKEYSMIQLSISSAFCRRESLLNSNFDAHLAFAEDAKCILKILLEKSALGVIKDEQVSYLYRKRTIGESSAVQRSEQDARWYLSVQRFFHQEMIQYCIDKFGYVPRFAQFTLAYDLQWKIKIKQIPDGLLSVDEEKEYLNTLALLFRYIDDDIILAQKHIYPEHKMYVLGKKYGEALRWVKFKNDLLLYYQNAVVFQLSRCQTCFEFLSIDDGVCTLEGYTVLFPLPYKKIELQIEVNGEVYPCDMVERNQVQCALGEPISYD